LLVKLETGPDTRINVGLVVSDGHEYSLMNLTQAALCLQSQKGYARCAVSKAAEKSGRTLTISDILEAQRKEREDGFFWHIETCGWDIIRIHSYTSDHNKPDKTVDGRVLELALGFSVWNIPVTVFLRGKRPGMFFRDEEEPGPSYHVTVRGDYEIFAKRMAALYNERGSPKNPWEIRVGYGVSGPGWNIVRRTGQTGWYADEWVLETGEDLDEAAKFGLFLQKELHKYDWRDLILKKKSRATA